MIYLIDDVDSTVERILSDQALVDSGLGKRKVLKTLKSFQGDEIATSVFLKKYALRDENNKIIEFTLEEAKGRWAKAIMEGEKLLKGKKTEEYFQELYEHMLPAGRQMYALGNTSVSKVTYSNCYVTKIEDDSIEGIYDAAKRCARTYSYGGGIGLCIGELRPNKSKVSNSAGQSTGAVSFMDLFSHTTGLIGQSGRRGALLLSIPVDHPDIEEFIDIKKSDLNKVRYANISVKVTDEFLKAAEEDADFELSFVTKHEEIKRTVRAKNLWNKIISSAHQAAEPGILFWDRMVERSPSEIYEGLQVHSTNPCGEIVLEKGGACVLSSILLHSFVDSPFTNEASFNFVLFKEMVARGVRHLDNVIEMNISKHPLEEQRMSAQNGRRMGLGITGLADALSALNIQYDSQDALDFVDEIMQIKMETEYLASVELAKERGSFPLFNPNRHFEQGFCKDLPEHVKKAAKKDGLRNVTISTIAPSGSLSIMAQCSSGLEPIYALKYKRFVEMGEKIKKEFWVFHQGMTRFFNATGQEEVPSFWKEAHQVDYSFRIKMQGLLQRYVDSSISSTINLSNDIPVETVGKIYLDAWKEGLKGVTVYREGSREGILVTDDYAKEAGIPDMDSVTYKVRAEGGDKFYIIVSYTNSDIKKPYQVFVLSYKQAEKDSFIKISNQLIKMLQSAGVPEKRIQKYSDRSNNSLEKLTRFLSLSMKTENVDKATDILNDHAFVGTLAYQLYTIFSKSLVAKNSICKNPDCQGSNVRMEEGCMVCVDCGWSGCS